MKASPFIAATLGVLTSCVYGAPAADWPSQCAAEVGVCLMGLQRTSRLKSMDAKIECVCHMLGEHPECKQDGYVCQKPGGRAKARRSELNDAKKVAHPPSTNVYEEYERCWNDLDENKDWYCESMYTSIVQAYKVAGQKRKELADKIAREEKAAMEEDAREKWELKEQARRKREREDRERREREEEERKKYEAESVKKSLPKAGNLRLARSVTVGSDV